MRSWDVEPIIYEKKTSLNVVSEKLQYEGGA
jgi:hypothetical protein